MGEFSVVHFDKNGNEKYAYKTFRDKVNGVTTRGISERKNKGEWKEVPFDFVKREKEIKDMNKKQTEAIVL